MSSFQLTVATPQGNMLQAQARQIILRGAAGDLAILAGHVPFITTVKPCRCRIALADGSERTGKTDGGLLTVSADSVTVLCGIFAWE